MSELRDHCGVMGVFGPADASALVALGLHALQHRGQESAGVASAHDGRILRHRAMGLVQDALPPEAIARLPGRHAIGHVRYSTAGASALENAQPLVMHENGGMLAVAHNGNLVNAPELRRALEAEGAAFASTTDTEVILHLVAREKAEAVEERIAGALARCNGSYSLVFSTPDRLIAARDPHGFRPLVLGRLRGGWAIASETCAFGLIDAEPVREIEPGEVVVIDETGVRTVRHAPATRGGRCVFELIYFARPDSEVFSRPVHAVRRAFGRALAAEHPADVDVVIPVPDSGMAGALGYAEALGKPFDLGLVRSHYAGRTFIEPEETARPGGVQRKLGVVREIVRGRDVAVVDDSIVRGNTARQIVRLLRQAGAKSVHLRITAPPTAYPCFYGIDTPTRAELLASGHDADQVAQRVDADSIGYLSIDGLHRAAQTAREGFCDACFTGDYPVPFEATEDARRLIPLGLWRAGPSRAAGS